MKMTYWIIGGVVVIILIAVVSFLVGRLNPSSDIVGQLTEQIRIETSKQYENRLSDLNVQLKASQAAYSESQKRYDSIIKKLQEIKDGKNAVKPPQNASELNTRFTALGYTPISK